LVDGRFVALRLAPLMAAVGRQAPDATSFFSDLVRSARFCRPRLQLRRRKGRIKRK
jgi:hypothetical protein